MPCDAGMRQNCVSTVGRNEGRWATVSDSRGTRCDAVGCLAWSSDEPILDGGYGGCGWEEGGEQELSRAGLRPVEARVKNLEIDMALLRLATHKGRRNLIHTSSSALPPLTRSRCHPPGDCVLGCCTIWLHDWLPPCRHQSCFGRTS